MQKRVTEAEGETAEPSWYLTRDGKQYGPLTDRELSLFAEGGNFKEGDLVWTAGLDTWKPADAIFDLAPPPELDADEKPDDAHIEDAHIEDAPVFLPARATDAEFSFEPDGEGLDAADDDDHIFSSPEPDDTHPIAEPQDHEVEALVQALNGRPARKLSLKERAIDELKKFAVIFLYLWVVFIVLLLHEWIVLSQNHIGFKFYGLAAINALLLGKIMLVAESFRFAERLNAKPLIYPIAYKSAAFTTMLFIAYILEEMIIGWFRGDGFLASMPPMGGGILSALSFWIIFALALVPFFAFKEVGRVLGPDKFRTMLLGRRRVTL